LARFNKRTDTPTSPGAESAHGATLAIDAVR
jgi:hypothetical protein